MTTLGPTFARTIDSPVGPLLLTSDGTALTRLHFDGPLDPSWQLSSCAVIDAAARQIDEYFAGRRTTFDVPLAPGGTSFQRAVWEALRAIPFGRTTNYGAIALRIGSPTASRAVGAANGRNPIAIIVPCHRVVGADGRLVGFGGGVERKVRLLEHERRTAGFVGEQLPLAL